MSKETFSVGFVGRLKHGDLLEALAKHGWNQSDGARFLGISPSQFGRMINMQEVPKIEEVPTDLEIKLAELTGKSMSELWPEAVFTKEFVEAPKVLNSVREVPIPALLSSFQQRQLSDPRHLLGQKELIADVERVLDSLEPRLQEVIRLRFFDGLTLREAGKEMSVGPERVRQIEARALRALRLPHRSRGLKKHL